MLGISRRALVGLLGAGAVASAARGAAFAAPDSGPINETGFVKIGGIEQWIAIQGRDVRNPIILFLHGGPGEAQSPFLDQFVPWENDFTVVNWDQRGSGKTFGKGGVDTSDMTPERMAADAVEIAAHVQERLGKRKIIIVGHSWGAMLGLLVIKGRPDLFSAFVATGLPVNWELSLKDREQWARVQFTATGDTAALKALDEAAKLQPFEIVRVQASRKVSLTPSDLKYLEIEKKFTGGPPFPTTGDVNDWISGIQFTGPKLYHASMTFDARTLGFEMTVPFFVFQGRDDHMASYTAAKNYFDEVRAPKKAFVTLDGGHFALFSSADQFIAALRTHVKALPEKA